MWCASPGRAGKTLQPLQITRAKHVYNICHRWKIRESRGTTPLERCCLDYFFLFRWVVYHFAHSSIRVAFVPIISMLGVEPGIKSRFFYLIHAISLQTWNGTKAKEDLQHFGLLRLLYDVSCHLHADRARMPDVSNLLSYLIGICAMLYHKHFICSGRFVWWIGTRAVGS